MAYDLDHQMPRRRFESIKWHRYPEDVLPLWVADMDFPAPEPVIQALRKRVEHGVFGYGRAPTELRQVIVARLSERYGWRVSEDHLIFLPGVVPGFNLACRALADPGQGVLIQTPVYRPILEAAAGWGLANDRMELTEDADRVYSVDFDLMERTIADRTRIFILCNPHNPVGRVFRRDELERMAEICLRHEIIICSDEIHCDLLLDDNEHTPIASLASEVAHQTITLMAPSKTYNIAGLKCAVAIVEDPVLRRRLRAARSGLVSGANVLGYAAALAAYREGQPWLDAVLAYLERNRDLLLDYVEQELPGISMTGPEGTYLAWLSCHGSAVQDRPYEFFLERAKVALVDGAIFGEAGRGFVRLNFGCPRSTLLEALGRMRAALKGLTPVAGS